MVKLVGKRDESLFTRERRRLLSLLTLLPFAYRKLLLLLESSLNLLFRGFDVDSYYLYFLRFLLHGLAFQLEYIIHLLLKLDLRDELW